MFWTAKTRDAELHLLTQLQGNGVTTTQAFDPNRGLVQSILAGTSNAVSNQTFKFDPLGDLTARTWLNTTGGTVTENACYDGLNRLTSTLITTGGACTGTGAVTVAYDALGNITEKSDVCATANCFVYGGTGRGPHALASIVGTYNGVANPTFTYDANGLMTGGAARAVTATTFNMAATITDGSNTAALAYDTEHARYKMTTTGLNAAVTNYLNDSSTGAMEEKVVAAGVTTWRDYILADGKLVAQRFCTGTAPCSSGVTVDYFVLDHLGSAAVIVNSSGSVLSRLAYDAWGKRRNADGSAINCVAGTSPPNSVTRGFTGQEMLDGVCLINFNARIYDPSLGRFMSADPSVGDDTIPQELNRFSYVLDNPLSLTDPSGLCFLGCFWKSWIFRDIFALAVVAFIVPEALPEIDAALGATGPLATVINAGISGGVFGAISTGSLKGAALDALQAGLFAEAGNLLSSNGLTKSFFGIGHAPSVFIAHGFIGGLVSEIGGGRFSAGFLAGGISSLAPTPAGGQPWEATVDGAVESAALGGVGSILGGGKFENGAVTGAFGYLFSEAEADLQQKQTGTLPNPSEYTTTPPADVAKLESDPLVTDWESNVRTSLGFNNPDVSDRYEVGIWVYTNDITRDEMIIRMPPSVSDAATGLYRSINAGIPPVEPGYTVDLAIHDHPFPLSGPTMGYPQPSQDDINYVSRFNINVIVVSHQGNYYFCPSVTGH